MSPAEPPRVVCFGELLLRLDTTSGNRFVQAESYTARYTGAEANVAVFLAGLGMRSSVVSRVPANDIGQACVNQLRRYGVDTAHVLRGGERLGLLYVEPGFGARASRVLYDRSHSSFSEIEPGQVDWARILAGSSWLHVSGTAGALGPRVERSLREGLEHARSLGIGTSLDCNYRASLWSRGEMRTVLGGLLPWVSLFAGSFEDAELFSGDGPGGVPLESPGDAALRLGRRLLERFGIARSGFTTRGGSSAGTAALTGYLCSDAGLAQSATIETPVLDRIGSGDAFTAGLIFGLLRGEPDRIVVQRAARAAALKLTIPGDFALLSLDELDGFSAERSRGVIR